LTTARELRCRPPPYYTGPTDGAEPPLAIDDLVVQAHRQRIPYETGEQWLERLPERLRALADLVLGDKMSAEEIAYAVAVLIDGVEHAPGNAHSRQHRAEPAR
jgi:hypothetical protein